MRLPLKLLVELWLPLKLLRLSLRFMLLSRFMLLRLLSYLLLLLRGVLYVLRLFSSLPRSPRKFPLRSVPRFAVMRVELCPWLLRKSPRSHPSRMPK